MGKKNNSKKRLPAGDRPALFSERQRRALLLSLLALFVGVAVIVPLVEALRCKAACLRRVKTPYPEIACSYQCPWPWVHR